jgi:hypothetical protein
MPNRSGGGGETLDVLDFFPDISFHLIPKCGKKSFIPFFREKSLFPTSPERFFCQMKKLQMKPIIFIKQTKKCHMTFFGRNFFDFFGVR